MSARRVSSVTHHGGQTTSSSCCGPRIRRCASRIQRKGRPHSSRPRTSATCGSGTRATPRTGSWTGCKRSRRWEAPGPMRTSSSSTKHRAWALSWHGSSCVWPQILRIPPRQDRKEDPAEEDKAERETDAVPEILGEVVRYDHGDDDVHQWNQIEENPPDRLAGDLEHYDSVVDRNDRVPARLARFREHPPDAGDFEDGDRADDHPDHRTDLRPCRREAVLRHGATPGVKVAPR